MPVPPTRRCHSARRSSLRAPSALPPSAPPLATNCDELRTSTWSASSAIRPDENCVYASVRRAACCAPQVRWRLSARYDLQRAVDPNDAGGRDPHCSMRQQLGVCDQQHGADREFHRSRGQRLWRCHCARWDPKGYSQPCSGDVHPTPAGAAQRRIRHHPKHLVQERHHQVRASEAELPLRHLHRSGLGACDRVGRASPPAAPALPACPQRDTIAREAVGGGRTSVRTHARRVLPLWGSRACAF